MSVRNHALPFRPLLGGIAIYNPKAGGVGTLGLIATSDGVDRWIVSAHHVLCRPAGEPCGDGEVVLQPPKGSLASAVARTSALRRRPDLDCAAALVETSVPTSELILGLPPLATPTVPCMGMRVIKSGAETGVTEGVVAAFEGDRVTISPARGASAEYDLSQLGDSGAIWIDATTHAPIALHTAGNAEGQELAFGVVLLRVLQSLELRLLVG